MISDISIKIVAIQFYILSYNIFSLHTWNWKTSQVVKEKPWKRWNCLLLLFGMLPFICIVLQRVLMQTLRRVDLMHSKNSSVDQISENLFLLAIDSTVCLLGINLAGGAILLIKYQDETANVINSILQFDKLLKGNRNFVMNSPYVDLLKYLI